MTASATEIVQELRRRRRSMTATRTSSSCSSQNSTNKVCILTHPSFQHHTCGGESHPESPQRIIALQRQLPSTLVRIFKEDDEEVYGDTTFSSQNPSPEEILEDLPERRLREMQALGVDWKQSDEDVPLACKQDLIRAGHTSNYVNWMFDKFEEVAVNYQRCNIDGAFLRIDSDTSISPFTKEAALRGAGATIRAVDLILGDNDDDDDSESTNYQHVFCLVRPPGHHATRTQSMGFCYFNNVMVAAKYAQTKYDLKRIAIIDFDVHHGNGTQDLVLLDDQGEDDNHDSKSILFISIHESPLYPHTGLSAEENCDSTVLNFPIEAGTEYENVSYQHILNDQLLPALEHFQPDLLLFSAGFDCHIDDPLADIRFESHDFYKLTSKILSTLNSKTTVIDQKRMKSLSLLEGGYNVPALVESSAYHLKALIENS